MSTRWHQSSSKCSNFLSYIRWFYDTWGEETPAVAAVAVEITRNNRERCVSIHSLLHDNVS